MTVRQEPVRTCGQPGGVWQRIRRVGVVALLAGSCVFPVCRTHAEEMILGRVSVDGNRGEGSAVGPLRLRSRLETIFREFLRRRQVKVADVTYDTFAEVLSHHRLVLLKDGDAAAASPAQWEPAFGSSETPSTDGHLVWIAGRNQTESVAGEYTLILREDTPPQSALNVQDVDNRHLLVSYGGRPVLRYNYGIVRQRPDRSGPYDRACYMHPVWTPSGKVVTGDFSPEHIHQRGVYLAWRSTRIGDEEVDFWGLGDSPGRVLPSGTPPSVINGPVFSKLILSNRGLIDGTVAFDELVEVTIYAGEVLGGWLIDVQVQQVPRSPMELPKIYYGGMSFRGPAGWLTKDSSDVQRALARGVAFEGADWLPPGTELDVLTSEGHDRRSGDRTTARWIDYTGPLGDGWGGLAMFDHRSSPRYPTPLRIHPELPYFNFAFVQQQPFTILPDQPLRLTYRIRVHDGPPDREADEQIARAFNNGPNVTWKSP